MAQPNSPTMHIVLIAGEASGDYLGAQLIHALHTQCDRDIAFSGVGGPLMAAAGMPSWVPQSDLAVMGLLEVLPRARLLKRHIQTVADHVVALQPDILVSIDSPGFAFRVVDKLQEYKGLKVHYVAPQVWAWRPKRAAHLGKRYDFLLTLFDFEPPLFTKHGLPARFVGHAAVEAGFGETAAGSVLQELKISDGAPVLGVLPGSRRGEIRRHAPVFSEVIDGLSQKFPDLHILIPTLPGLEDLVHAQFQDAPVPVHIISDLGRKRELFAAMTVALAVSGTVTLELALAGTPTLVAYRANPVTIAIVRRLLLVRHISLVNILADAEVVPEFLQERCRPDLLTAAVQGLLDNPAARARQCERAQPCLDRLWPTKDHRVTPSQVAAHTVLELLAGPLPQP